MLQANNINQNLSLAQLTKGIDKTALRGIAPSTAVLDGFSLIDNWESIPNETSEAKGIPLVDDDVVKDVRAYFKFLKSRGFFKGKRLAIRYRGPRYGNYHNTKKENATTFSVYVYRNCPHLIDGEWVYE